MADGWPQAGSIFVGLAIAAFAAAAVWETRRPLFLATPDLPRRWLSNFGLYLAGYCMGFLAVPALAALTAWAARQFGAAGLLGSEVALGWQVLATLLALDALRWATHRATHRWHWLWRLHRVHHCDTEFDCTVGVRFHPLETLLVALLSSATVLVLGVSPLAVVLAEAVFITHNFFCHANAALPPRAEALLGRWIITPDLHRVHHAASPQLANLNFGTVLTLWDHLASSHHSVPREAQAALRFGVSGVEGPWTRSLWRLLALPLRRDGSA